MKGLKVSQKTRKQELKIMKFNNKLWLEVEENHTSIIFIKGVYVSLKVRCVMLGNRKNNLNTNV